MTPTRQRPLSELTLTKPLAEVLREGLIPNDWRTFNARAMLGSALLGQRNYEDAEPFLLSGYEGMKQREVQIPAAGRPRLKEAL
jgi:eukaryotic-like serine/threonine-protein kinase